VLYAAANDIVIPEPGPSQQTEQSNVLVLETMPCRTENCWQIR
jgi:hypothetical protein